MVVFALDGASSWGVDWLCGLLGVSGVDGVGGGADDGWLLIVSYLSVVCSFVLL